MTLLRASMSIHSVARLGFRHWDRRTIGVFPIVALTGLLVTLGCSASRNHKIQMGGAVPESTGMEHVTASNDGNGGDLGSSRQLPGAELGIEVLSLRRSAEGYMLDLRYRVRDLAKAAPTMDPQVQPVLTDQRTGAKFVVPNPPKVGPLRQRPAASALDRTYFVLFANPGRFLKTGDQVTLGFGDRRVENLVIE